MIKRPAFVKNAVFGGLKMKRGAHKFSVWSASSGASRSFSIIVKRRLSSSGETFAANAFRGFRTQVRVDKPVATTFIPKILQKGSFIKMDPEVFANGK